MLGTSYSIIVACLLLTNCSGSFDQSKVKEGMSTKELVDVLGEPTEKLPLTRHVSFWRYEDDNTVMIEHGKVVNVGIMTDEDYRNTVEDLNNAMDSLHHVRSVSQ